jgi:hypothetical protein
MDASAEVFLRPSKRIGTGYKPAGHLDAFRTVARRTADLLIVVQRTGPNMTHCQRAMGLRLQIRRLQETPSDDLVPPCSSELSKFRFANQ